MDTATWVELELLGRAVGTFGTLIGAGGGFLLVPPLLILYPAHVATATSHFILAVMSFVGTAPHVLNGDFVEGVRRTIALGIGVLIGAQFGAWLSQRVHGRSIMRSLAVGLLGVGGRLAMHAAVGAGIALISAAAQLARVDRTVIERHLLAMPSGGVGLVAIAATMS